MTHYEPRHHGTDGGGRNTFSSIASSIASSAIQAAEPHVMRVLEDGSLIRKPMELIQNLIQPVADNSSHYSPLPTPSSIRLLTIEPGDTNSLIQCTMRVVDLENYVRYKALSYSWAKDKSWTRVTSDSLWKEVKQTLDLGAEGGNEERREEEGKHRNSSSSSLENPRTIICNGKTMLVYPNLHDALLQLRKLSPGSYWIDAVCINQSDIPERNAQVRMMDRIYSRAEKVTIWLGACPPLISAGAARLERLRGNLPQRVLDGNLFDAPPGESSDGALFSAALYLMQRRYFRRLWVLQELCLAHSLEIYFGEHQISPETISGIVSWAQSPTYDNDKFGRLALAPLTRTLRPLYINMPIIPALFETRQRLQRGESLTLQQWLVLTKGREASDARDFVNGGLSLIKPRDRKIKKTIHLRDTEEIPELWPRLHVDYNAGTEEVLRNLAACLLSQPGGINLLSIAARIRDTTTFLGDPNHELASLPSWIPNLGSEESRAACVFSTQGISHFAACTALENHPRISSDGRTLRIGAAHLGTVRSVCKANYLGGDPTFYDLAVDLPREYAWNNEQGLEALVGTCLAGTWRHREGDALLAFAQLVSAGMDGLYQDNPRKSSGFSRGQRRESEEALKRARAALRAKYPELPWTEADEQVGEQKVRLARRLLHDSGRLMAWRCLFTTREGHVGLGPSWLAEGDRVMLVKGGYVPYVFRDIDRSLEKRCRAIEDRMEEKKNSMSKAEKNTWRRALYDTEDQIGQRDGWVLIGEAYVRGVMEGQAVKPETKFERIAVI